MVPAVIIQRGQLELKIVAVLNAGKEAEKLDLVHIAGRHHTLRCMGNMGVCRPSCRKTEQPYLYCLNYQPCCLQSYMRISISGREEKNDWSQQNRWPKIS
nr:beta-defensin 119-like [Neomonachus schauinslandi]